jgi:mannose/fructose/N-acetylgalactosamine-specific phosphotransferase system component IIC
MSWPIVALMGGVVGLDATSFPQVMISRPLVAGALTGWILGDAALGAALGALHEIFSLAVLPVGASRYPEAGTASVAATAALVSSPAAGTWSALLVALVFALLWERVGGTSVVLYRRNIEKLLLTADGNPLPAARLEGRHTLTLALDFARAALLTLAGALLGSALVTFLAPRADLPAWLIRSAIAVAAAAVLGGSLRVFGGWSERRRAFVLGAIAGCALLLIQ